MKMLRKAVLVVSISALGTGLMPMVAAAATGTETSGSAYANGPDWIGWRLESYRNYVAQMSPENRTKLAAMQDKLLQMEMDQKSAMMKMDMEIAKTRRDMEMFILSNTKYDGH